MDSGILLTAMYEVEDNSRPVIYLAYRTDDGKVVERVDDFDPYFYIYPSYDGDKYLPTLFRSIKRVELVKKLYEGKMVQFSKVYTRLPNEVRDIREIFRRKFGRQHFSADILFPFRYMYDRDIGLFYNDKVEVPDLKIMSIDIEKSPRTGEFYVMTAWDGKKEYIIESKDEVEKFCKDVEYDILVGHNITNYDLPELEKDGVPIRDMFFNPLRSKETKESFLFWEGHGVCVADTYRIAKSVWPSLPQYSLDYLVKHFSLGAKKEMPMSKLDEIWRKDRSRVIEYCLHDAKLSYELFKFSRWLERAIAIGTVARLPLSNSLNYVTSWINDSLMIRDADRHDVAVPSRQRNVSAGKYKGAFVYVAEGGLYENVISLDFRSLYPSVIMAYNVSPDTYMKRPEGECYISPIGVAFTKEREGVLPRVVRRVFRERMEMKKKYKETGDKFYDDLQYALKIILNSFYGYMGTPFSRFYRREVAESITAWARERTIMLKRTLEKKGFRIILMDTDSAFVQITQGDPVEVGEALSEELSDENFTLEFEYAFDKFYTAGKKKRYFGHTFYPKEDIMVKGFELKRGDSFPYQRKVMKKCIELILTEGVEEARLYASRALKALKHGAVKTEELVIGRSVKDPSEYANPDSMVTVSVRKKLEKMGYEVFPYQKIAYVVTGRDISGRQRAEPWVVELYDKIKPDYDYYYHRLLHSLEGLFAGFKFTTSDPTSPLKRTTLEVFK